MCCIKGPLVRWLKINFSECFTAWVHVKALRVFVESVLRYGLPVNFQAVLMYPNKKSVKRLREVLNQLYQHLDSSGGSSKNMDVSLLPRLSGLRCIICVELYKETDVVFNSMSRLWTYQAWVLAKVNTTLTCTTSWISTWLRTVESNFLRLNHRHFQTFRKLYAKRTVYTIFAALSSGGSVNVQFSNLNSIIILRLPHSIFMLVYVFCS